MQRGEKVVRCKIIKEVEYPDWIAKVVPVKKKNGQILCVDFQDLNKGCSKDSFPLPLPDILFDQTVGFQMFSSIDGFSGYNQIQMHPADEEKTSFYTPFGIFCNRVMPILIVGTIKCECESKEMSTML